MHEMSIAQSIIEIVQETVPPEQLPTVSKVIVKVGQLTAVVPESLHFCYQALVSGTPLEHSQLVIEEISTRAECQECGTNFQPEGLVFFCPNCGSGNTRILSGQELQVSELEVE